VSTFKDETMDGARLRAPQDGGGADEAASTHADSLTVSVVVCAYTMKRWDDVVGAVRRWRRSS
jgi:hypothetical protein